MNEFLTDLSSGQPLLWSLFILGVVAAAALGLNLFWDGLYQLVSTVVSLFNKDAGKKGASPKDDVLP